MARSTLHHVVEGQGRSIALLHPIGLDHTCWRDVAARLVDRFRVISIDLPGHGRSAPAAAGATLSDYARAVRDTLDEVGGGPFCVAGLSFGGMIAQVMGVEQPECCDALLISGCPSTLPDAGRTMMRERGQVALREGMAAMIDATLERWFTPEFLLSGGADRVRKQLETTDPENWATAWSAIAGLDCLPKLGEIRAASLCVAGERDAATSVEAVKLIADSIPGARLMILPGASHMMQLEKPADYADAVASVATARTQ